MARLHDLTYLLNITLATLSGATTVSVSHLLQLLLLVLEGQQLKGRRHVGVI